MGQPFVHPYAHFLDQVEKPTRYVGGEYQEVRKDPAAVQARICLAFPDTYEIGMSHLGTKILYSILNKTAGIACERAFAPWLDMEQQLRKHALPMVSLETATRLRDFDVLGFSLQYELTYTNILLLLDLGGLPLRAAARGDDAPLVIAGGPTATHPEPLAPFIDAFFIGEAEETLPALVLEFAELRRAGVPRRERLIRLAAKYPLYVPELYATARDEETGFEVVAAPADARVPARPQRVWVKDINKFPFPDDSPLPYAEAIFDRMAVEVARGCTEGCRFCQAGMIYRPVRERDPVAVIDAIIGGVKKGGYDETAITGLSTADYSCITPLVKTAMAKLRDEKVSLSVSSLRAYGLNDDLLAEMSTMKAQGLTFAPEAGTQRMRDVITKNVTEEDITESATRVFGRGFQRMKLYFMIGLPTEQDEDVLGIVETAARVKKIGKAHFHGAEVTASVSTHVPKPHTPFQWAAMDTEADTERKQGILAEAARRLRVDLKMHENYQSHLEAIFSRGDRACGSLLERAYLAGCRFDGWDDVLRPEVWDQAIAEEREQNGFEPGKYLGTIPVTARLPWDHIDVGLEDGFLAKEYRKALKDRLSPPCGKPFKQLLHPSSVAQAEAERARKLVCYDCGVACDLTAMKEERLYFLRRMNAWTPPVAPPPAPRPRSEKLVAEAAARDEASATGAEAPIFPRDKKSMKPVTSIVQGQAVRYRFRYSKLGRPIYLGHLDLIRHLPRIFRRAGFELFYSEGFHPKPELSFGPALGLGIPSFGEILDVKMVGVIDAEIVRAGLQAVTLEGLDFLSAVRLDETDRALGRVLTGAEYAALLPEGVSAEVAALRFATAEPLSLIRPGSEEKGRRKPGRRVDVRHSLEAVDVASDAVAARLRDGLGWPSGRILTFRIAVTALGSAKPSEVVEALCGPEAASGASLARMGLRAHPAGREFDGKGQGAEAAQVVRMDVGLDPLDLAGLRAGQRVNVAARLARPAVPAADVDVVLV
jgi:radical SAM family uncharacterized protein/radical SAM-linked protein